MFPEDCQERLTQIYGPGILLREHYLQPTSPPHDLGAPPQQSQADLPQSRQFGTGLGVERILLPTPEALPQLRDRGLLYYQLGRWRQAQQDFKYYLAQVPQSGKTNRSDVHLIQEILQRLESHPD